MAKDPLEAYFEEEEKRYNDFAASIPDDQVIGGGAWIPDLDDDGTHFVGEEESNDE